MISSFTFMIITGFALTLATAEDKDFQSSWWNVICEHDDNALFRDISDCFSQTDAEVQSLTFGCISNVHPSSGKDTAVFLKAVCEDRSLADKLNECLLQNPAVFQKWHKESESYEECLKSVFAKHKLQVDWPDK